MTRRRVDKEDPDRLYTVTRGRSRAGHHTLDLVTLIVSAEEPTADMQSEHVRILRICQQPTAVVELSSDLGLPVSVVRILVSDLIEEGRVTARHPHAATAGNLPRADVLKEVLIGLRNL